MAGSALNHCLLSIKYSLFTSLFRFLPDLAGSRRMQGRAYEILCRCKQNVNSALPLRFVIILIPDSYLSSTPQSLGINSLDPCSNTLPSASLAFIAGNFPIKGPHKMFQLNMKIHWDLLCMSLGKAEFILVPVMPLRFGPWLQHRASSFADGGGPVGTGGPCRILWPCRAPRSRGPEARRCHWSLPH